MSPTEGKESFRDDEKLEGSTLVNLNGTDTALKNPREHFQELNEAREDYNDSVIVPGKRTQAPTPTPNQGSVSQLPSGNVT